MIGPAIGSSSAQITNRFKRFEFPLIGNKTLLSDLKHLSYPLTGTMDDDSTPPPPTDDAPAPLAPVSTSGSPTDFLKGVVGKRVVVRLTSGVDYRGVLPPVSFIRLKLTHQLVHSGVLSCLDGYMNIALEQTEEHVNGRVINRYGDAFIRGNNGTLDFLSLARTLHLTPPLSVLYISAAEVI